MKALVYDIDTEGWLQFERLIDLLLANSLSDVVACLSRLMTGHVMAGTYRQHLLETGRAIESCLLIDDLKRANRLYVANSVRGLVPAKPVSG